MSGRIWAYFWWLPIPEWPATTWRRLAWILTAGLLLLLSRLTWQPLGSEARLDFIDVGQGDATLIRTAAGESVLIDGGDRSEYMDYGQAVVTPFLRGQGITRLDYVLITHFDRDHMGGLFHVTDRMSVGEILLPCYPSGKPLEAEFIAHAQERGISMRRIARGDRLTLDGAALQVLHPPPTGWEHRADNEQSLVLRLDWAGLRIMLPGDAERYAEAALARTTDCRADILKAGHHGSHTSTSAVFLDAVAPRLVVVSTRSSPTRHGVHPEVRRRIEAQGIPIWRTDYHGGIRIRARGAAHDIQGARYARGYSLAPVASAAY